MIHAGDDAGNHWPPPLVLATEEVLDGAIEQLWSIEVGDMACTRKLDKLRAGKVGMKLLHGGRATPDPQYVVDPLIYGTIGEPAHKFEVPLQSPTCCVRHAIVE